MHLAFDYGRRVQVGPEITDVDAAYGWHGYVRIQTVNGGSVTYQPWNTVLVVTAFPHMFGSTVAYEDGATS